MLCIELCLNLGNKSSQDLTLMEHYLDNAVYEEYTDIFITKITRARKPTL